MKTFKEHLNSRKFYELMQSYRNMPISNQEGTIKAFNDVKKWLHKKHNKVNNPKQF